MLRRVLSLLILSLLPSAAYAHVGVGSAHGFACGFVHPLSGIDHILAMTAVGVFAAHLGGRAIWLVPASFVSVMAFAAALGMFGASFPFVETGIAVSVIVLGLIVAFELRVPAAAALAIVGSFAVFHGHAHGVELPENATALAYGIGFVIATSLLHAFGVGIGFVLVRAASMRGEKILQLSGYAMSLVGTVILLKLI